MKKPNKIPASLTEPKPDDLVSIYMVAQLCSITKETANRIMRKLPPGGKRRGYPAWKWSDAKSAIDSWRKQSDGDGTTKGRLDALKVRKLELEVDRLEGLSIPRDVLAEVVKRVIANARSILVQRITVELPSSILQGLPADSIREHCVKTVNEVLNQLAPLGKEFDDA